MMLITMAWRNIWRNKTRSIVIMLSVAIGMFAGVAVLALYKGMLSSRIRMVVDSEVGHLQIHQTDFKKDYHPRYVIPNTQLVIDKLKKIPEIRLVAPRSVTQGMLMTATGSAGVQINGVVPETEYKVSKLNDKIVQGDGFHDDKKNEIVVGKKLADKMKLKTGNKLVLTFTDSADNLVSSAFRVAAIYRSGNAPLDELNVYVKASTLNDLLTTGDAYNEIAVLLHNDNDVERVKQQLKTLFPNNSVESWKDISPETDLMVRTVDSYSYIIIVIILIALAFGILNTMLMSVLERTKEIGMMVALGTSRLRVFLLVQLETAFLTLVGAPFGLLVGYAVTKYFETHGLNLAGMGQDLMESFGFSTMIYPSFPWEKLVGIVLLVIGTAVVSCLIPAVNALRLQPVEALRR